MKALDRPGVGLFLLRIAMGSIFLLHGWMKLFGGREVFVRELLHMVGWSIPDPLIWIVTLLEIICGLALILGVQARWAALALAVEMIVVVVLFHARQGFFIVAVPNVPLAYGFEYHVALIGGLLCTAFAGPGALSLWNPRRPATV